MPLRPDWAERAPSSGADRDVEIRIRPYVRSLPEARARGIELSAHDHGDPEIGPITQRNPLALMKRAVSEMWRAERHLMQAEPALALPFEYEAYKYQLNEIKYLAQSVNISILLNSIEGLKNQRINNPDARYKAALDRLALQPLWQECLELIG